MKLVDILARELKVWPESAHLITQDDDGMLNEYAEGYTPRNTFGRVWSSSAKYLEGFADGDDDIRLPLADDFATTIVTRAQWQAAVDALAAQSSEAAKDMHDTAVNAQDLDGDSLGQVFDLENPPKHATHYSPEGEHDGMIILARDYDEAWRIWWRHKGKSEVRATLSADNFIYMTRRCRDQFTHAACSADDVEEFEEMGIATVLTQPAYSRMIA